MAVTAIGAVCYHMYGVDGAMCTVYCVRPVYVKNAAMWIVNADRTLRDSKRAQAVAGKSFFIGDGVRTMRQMSEVSGHTVTAVL